MLHLDHKLIFFPGLERGLEGMKVGGERVITIPSALGYGSKGAGEDIPPDSDLVFEVKVLKVG
jgi:FKBP-type peptidyl-prolyl cis-trans isomerase